MSSRLPMPPGRRCRGRRLAVAAALAGSPLLVGAAASAEPAEPAGTVTFTGGCGLLGSGLGARSSPDAEQVNLAAGSGLQFANQLGQPATLRLDGEAAADIPPGGVAEVVFHDGPVQATMQIDCLLGEPAGTVRVEVTPAAPAKPARPEQPAAGSDPGGSSAGAGSSSATEPGGPPTGGWWSDAPAAPPPGEGVAGEPAPADLPRGATAPEGGLSPRWGLATEPSSGGGSSTDPANVDRQAADGGRVAGELSRTSGSAPDDGPIGLLALVATVCVAGVSAGAIRAIVSLRTNRAAVG